MNFKNTVKLARKSGSRYIQRKNGNTIFDVVSYQAGLMDEEDVYADDWQVPSQSKISYFRKTGR